MSVRSMRIGLLFVLAFGVLLSGGASAQVSRAKPAQTAGTFKEIRWEELVPKGWNPYQTPADTNLGALADGSPRALQTMRDLREAFDNAPTVPALDGALVKIPGYVVPLEEVKGDLREFLLVPYFGACIHTPPPPANQIIHVLVSKGAKGIRAMDVVWVNGTLKTARQDSAMGTSGYSLNAASVDAYVAPSK